MPKSRYPEAFINAHNTIVAIHLFEVHWGFLILNADTSTISIYDPKGLRHYERELERYAEVAAKIATIVSTVEKTF